MATVKLTLLLAWLAVAAAYLAPLGAAPRGVTRSAPPMMKKCGGKGGHGTPTKNQIRRGKMRRLIWSCDSADKVRDVLLSEFTESTLVKMNWRTRHSLKRKIRSRAAQFGVEVSDSFAGWNIRPYKMGPDELRAKMAEAAS